MESYSSFSSSCSSSRETQSYNASLHTVRKPLAKQWNNKKPIAPLPPMRPKVYQVDPMDFRELVQKLTGRPVQAQQQQRLRRVAPPPLQMAETRGYLTGRDLSAPGPALDLFPSPLSDARGGKSVADGTTSFGMDQLLLSPSSYNWCASNLLSPGTISSLEHTTVS